MFSHSRVCQPASNRNGEVSRLLSDQKDYGSFSALTQTWQVSIEKGKEKVRLSDKEEASVVEPLNDDENDIETGKSDKAANSNRNGLPGFKLRHLSRFCESHAYKVALDDFTKVLGSLAAKDQSDKENYFRGVVVGFLILLEEAKVANPHIENTAQVAAFKGILGAITKLDNRTLYQLECQIKELRVDSDLVESWFNTSGNVQKRDIEDFIDILFYLCCAGHCQHLSNIEKVFCGFKSQLRAIRNQLIRDCFENDRFFLNENHAERISNIINMAYEAFEYIETYVEEQIYHFRTDFRKTDFVMLRLKQIAKIGKKFEALADCLSVEVKRNQFLADQHKHDLELRKSCIPKLNIEGGLCINLAFCVIRVAMTIAIMVFLTVSILTGVSYVRALASLANCEESMNGISQDSDICYQKHEAQMGVIRGNYLGMMQFEAIFTGSLLFIGGVSACLLTTVTSPICRIIAFAEEWNHTRKDRIDLENKLMLLPGRDVAIRKLNRLLRRRAEIG